MLYRSFDSLVRTARDAATVFPETQFADRLSATAFAATSDAYTAAQGLQLLQTASQSGKDELAKVTIEASTRFTIPGQQAQIPITVANTSEQRTTVSVTIVPESSGRVRSTAIDPVTIEPGQRITVPLDVVVTGVGTVRARVQLATKDGSTFGVGESISITTTAYQSFARSIVWLALAALLILAGRGIRTRRRSS